MKAIIYCRVSSEEQVNSLSLSTQERACREYCEKNNWEVVQVFVEEGESAKTTDRPVFLKTLQLCLQKKNSIQFLVVYSLSRFARNADDHIPITAKLRQAGVKLRSATEPLDDSIVGRSMEIMLALFAEIDNRMRADRTISGLKSALEINRWPFPTTIGYVKVKNATGQSVITVDAERAPLIESAFRQFATGGYTKKQVLDDVTAQGLRTREGTKLSQQSFACVLRNPFYTGWLVVPKWAIRKRGTHQPLADQATFDKVQAILAGRHPTATPCQRNRPDFPLRGLAKCGKCDAPMTGSWTTGRTKRYPYYSCSKHCKGMNHRAEKLEQQLLESLNGLGMRAELVDLFQKIVQDVWHEKQTHRHELAAVHKRRETELESCRQRLLDAYLGRQLISEETFKEQLSRLEAELAAIRTSTIEFTSEELEITELLNFTHRMVVNAREFWLELPLDQKQRFLRVLTPDGITVDEKGVVRTNVTCPIFSVLQPKLVEKTNLASLVVVSWNQILAWLRQVEEFRKSLNSLPAAA